MSYAQMLQTAGQFLKFVNYYPFQQLSLQLSSLHFTKGMLLQLMITNSGIHYNFADNLLQQCISCRDYSKICTGFF